MVRISPRGHGMSDLADSLASACDICAVTLFAGIIIDQRIVKNVAPPGERCVMWTAQCLSTLCRPFLAGIIIAYRMVKTSIEFDGTTKNPPGASKKSFGSLELGQQPKSHCTTASLTTTVGKGFLDDATTQHF